MIWDISSNHDLRVELDLRISQYAPDNYPGEEIDIIGILVNWLEKRLRQKDIVQSELSCLRAPKDTCFRMMLTTSIQNTQVGKPFSE